MAHKKRGGSDLALPARYRSRFTPGAPVAIVDIGSNSVRLVIYESATRIPAVLHNEKAICAIGRNMVSTGRLNDDGIILALEALKRFNLLANAHGVKSRMAVATAAARDAQNGRDFIRKAEAAWNSPIRILSGEEEARLAAAGVLAGAPDADGLVADLGGGSLDMVTVKDGKTHEAYTLPFGPLRLMDVAKGDPDKAREIVDKGLGKLDLDGLKGRSLFAVGGVWRSFARLDMEDMQYPLHVLQHYTIPRARALQLCRVVSRLSMRSLERMRIVSKRRAEALPYGSVVLERLIIAGHLKDVVVSAYGLREGLLFAGLAPKERKRDPLLEFTMAMNGRMARSPEHAKEMFAWLDPLFPGEDDEQRRLRKAICYLSDIGWRRHPDDRSLGAYGQVLTAPYAGADHRARAMIATAIFHRYSGDEDHPRELETANLLDREDAAYAVRVGLAARLAFALSISAPGELHRYRLKLTGAKIILEVPPRRNAVASDPVLKRLGVLAAAFDRKGEILVG